MVSSVKLVELNLYAPVLASALGNSVAADRLAVTEDRTQVNVDAFWAPLPFRFKAMLNGRGLLSNIEQCGKQLSQEYWGSACISE